MESEQENNGATNGKQSLPAGGALGMQGAGEEVRVECGHRCKWRRQREHGGRSSSSYSCLNTWHRWLKKDRHAAHAKVT